MFTVYHSNQVDILQSLVSELMQREPLDNIFQKEIVIVQSQGMAQWLQIKLADQLGIAANIDFPFPTQFISQLARTLMPDLPFDNGSNTESLTWKLFALLPKVMNLPQFEQLSHYLNIDKQERKSYQLASRIASLFDQYQVYRPDWIATWDAGHHVAELENHPAEKWQAELWRQLSAQHNLQHRANIYSRMLQLLSSPEFSVEKREGIPKRIFIFGITSLPPIYLTLLHEIGQHIDVHLMFANPCREYWGEITDKQLATSMPDTTPNPLLTSWGKLGRDNLFLLQEFQRKRDIEAFADYGSGNLLRAVQQDILKLYFEPETKRVIETSDHSISFHACHSEQREVEILYDYLLSRLDQDHELELRDCVVMVSDIDRYVPYIQSVFGNASQDRYLPFTISDQKASSIDPIVQGFFSILNFPQSRLSSEDLFNLIEIPSIAERFSISETQLTLLRKWIVESGIRFGLDSPHGWRFGLNRLLLGYTMDSEYGIWKNILPYNGATGLDAELIGQLAEFIEIVEKWVTKLTEPKTLPAWQGCCAELLTDFFVTNQHNQSILLLIEEEWQNLIDGALLADFNDEVSIAILSDAMQSRLEQNQLSHRFLVGKINFCTMMPMRSIPFKVVCLLGMNDNVYPRTSSALDFDLIAIRTRRGDRSRRNDDRYLFLEALLSAEQELYISYIGKEMKDDSERYPSVLVDELLEYIVEHYSVLSDELKLAAHFLPVLHTRTPFNPNNFINEPKSYADEWLPAATKSGAVRPFIEPISDITLETLYLDDLKRFYLHSIRLFLQKRFNYYLRYLDDKLPDAENFSLDALERYQLNQQLLDQLLDTNLNTQDLSDFYQMLALTGDYPDAAFGQIIYEEQTKAMQPLADKIRQERKQADAKEVNLTIAGYKVQGWISDVQSDGILRWRPSKLSIRDGMTLWIDHLVYCVINPNNADNQSRIYGREDNEWRFHQISDSNARSFLTTLVQGYAQGINQPLLLPLQSAWNWLINAYDKQTGCIESNAKAYGQLLQTWQGNFSQSGECDDYYARLYPELTDELAKQIFINAEQFLLPLLLSRSVKE